MILEDVAMAVARGTIGGFGLEYFNGYQRPKHVKVFEQIAEDLSFKKNLKYIIEVPPRHGKSVLFSNILPAFFITNKPDKKVLLASYAFELARGFALKVKTTLEMNNLIEFRTKLLRDFETMQGGGLIAAGVGGPITGKGASLLILDDPVKNLEQAQSKTYRDKTYDWFNSTFYTRREPGANVVLIQTRWNKDDLAGRLIKEDSGWEVIKFPAIAEEEDILGRKVGDALWPERFSLEELLDIKQRLGSYLWSALYQQSPVDKEGAYFEAEWFPLVDEFRTTKKIRYWDLAGSDKKKSDYSVGTLMGKRGDLYVVLDVVRFQKRPNPTEQKVKSVAELDGEDVTIVFEEEPGAGGKTLTDYYRRLLRGYNVKVDRKKVSKEIRARVLSSQAEGRYVFLKRGKWNKDFLDELEDFPNGEHDDQVDSASGAFHYLGVGLKGDEGIEILKKARL